MTDLETLRQLRDAYRGQTLHDSACCCSLCQFGRAAHAALGPDGCVTKELERLRNERDAVKADVERLTQHTKDAQKENSVLLARLVKLSAAASAYLQTGQDVKEALRSIVNEMPPQS